MKFVKAIWPFVAVAVVFMFMSAFKFNDQLTDQEKQKSIQKFIKFNSRKKRQTPLNNTQKKRMSYETFSFLFAILKASIFIL